MAYTDSSTDAATFFCNNVIRRPTQTINFYNSVLKKQNDDGKSDMTGKDAIISNAALLASSASFFPITRLRGP